MTSVPASFIRAHTRPERPSLVPEVQLLVAADVVALWEAMAVEQGRTAQEPPFWAAAWPGGQALARYVLDHPELVAGRTVLDLGAGSGLVAVAAVVAGAGRVIASEIDPFGRAAIPENAALNGVSGIEPVGDLLGEAPPGRGRRPGRGRLLRPDHDRAGAALPGGGPRRRRRGARR
ncbi:50S ribosomal protein L11 methyltransferase [Blastococcus sp. TML/M2B]|uniref:class I SAM-dependent methyltransferase n=1 Tax=Blastococcus sp. TML/M2B TaxID=2798727 RepID=UPI002816824C|nr:50S ribosomal protein L11 methyltransferase [Blastococcus sp. TML/M2B]